MGKNLSKLVLSVMLGIIFSSEIFLATSQANLATGMDTKTVATKDVADGGATKNSPDETATQSDTDFAQVGAETTGPTEENTAKPKNEVATNSDITRQIQASEAKNEISSSNTEEKVASSNAVSETTASAPAETSSNKTTSQAPAFPQSETAPVNPAPALTSIAEAPSSQPAVNSGPVLNIGGRTLSVVESNSMAEESGANVLRFNKLLRGHNSDQVFRVLYDMNSCDKSANCTFSLTEQGTTKNYQIKSRVEYTVEDYNTGRLSAPDGNTTMFNLTTKAKGHDYALFTCFGEYDASIGRYKQVLVLYADRV